VSTKIGEVLNDAVIRTTPPLTVTALGYTMQVADWVYVVTFVYVMLQIVVIAPKVFITLFKVHYKLKDKWYGKKTRK
jgi:L-cystine uptake protein TcyP (sodium:dicarboxylate symporter family)